MQLTTWQISDRNGNSATILNLGARLINWQSPASRMRNIVVGYDNIEDFLDDKGYMGAIAGPFANRIANAQFQHNGQTVQLGANEGNNHLHGGADGLEKVHWQLVSRQPDSITLRHQHRPSSGHVGYPGNIDFLVTYKIEAENGLALHFQATSELATPIGPTGHAYFNLGDHSGDINNHKLQLNAAEYTPVDENNIPTGEIVPVADKFDFQEPKQIMASLDNNFVLRNSDLAKRSAVLSNEKTKLSLEVYTDYPGVQIYTADGMSAPFVSRNAICIEPQYFPDSPNKPDFPFEFTTPQKPFNKTIRYQMRAI